MTVTPMIDVEAYLCEDSQTVMLSAYRGEELISTEYQSLPLPITEETFESLRSEWERAWEETSA
ncbi:hypothetical protein GHK39_31490 [Sinorhizobium medicae]|uniref:hypothetical protein n=1 Tax=Sinorhizobium medicae TaxID=110321 RepID=UPI000FD73AD4|nr:hypothetical protein [Sinorhizobium medicae]MDX0415209.1 hypothetical protein [Sinorhizobium medicae]MDX0446287.1 hypothetical protein [Sinorhizobium medicae]MDX0476306.1 hypothetical protein [Sinorhizobium medicae]MDX0659946.1 hypothetical protein [Sinorhizobium medicae]MDX0974731.1 hypothetical protein [Sinorhizobium medicae]